ncbi:hypothetical protein FEM03_12705 [Phragmitibacter flavus]|uniref:KTSC domain-containing protein n=1 Tax=Phragmitibacter flavus TaxID=2576071 RepID=A0A5R8KE44_9BACT|nr:hypothetical protein [Phragmitibacter flavus]TLD70572.1 hypothetical protein FEM03_12705 [Phragmitibacter flavus]
MKTALAMVLAILSQALPLSAEENQNPVEPSRFDISTLSGEIYKNSRLIKVTPADLTVMHDAGVAKIGFENLNPTWQQKFGYDPAKADAYREKIAIQNREAEDRRQQLSLQRERTERLAIAKIEAEERRLAAQSKDPAPLAPLPGEENRPLLPAPTTTVEIIPSAPPLGAVHDPGISTRNSSSRRWRSGDGIYSVDGYYPPFIWSSPSRPWSPHYHPHHHHHHPHHHSGSFISPPIIRITR